MREMKWPGIVLIGLACLLAGLAAGFLVGRDYLRRDASVPPGDEEPLPGGRMVLVFFVRYDAPTNQVRLQEVERRLAAGEQPLQGSIRALLDGPTEAEKGDGLVTEIPQGTTLLGARIESGIAYLDFNDRVDSGGGSLSMMARLHQILYTATQFADTEAMELLIEGRRPEAFGGEGIIIDSPMRRPAQRPVF